MEQQLKKTRRQEAKEEAKEAKTKEERYNRSQYGEMCSVMWWSVGETNTR